MRCRREKRRKIQGEKNQLIADLVDHQAWAEMNKTYLIILSYNVKDVRLQ